MKILTSFTLFLLLLFSGQSFAQKKVEVEYERITYSMDNLSRSTYFKLFASKDLSVSRLESIGKKEGGSLGTKKDGGLTYTANVPKPSVRNDLYVDINKSTIHMVSPIRGEMQKIYDTPPKIDWHITNENKEIGDYLAIKAEARFRGRDYEAWFTPEIPIPAGPWKLFGLPGLILEVTDKEKQYVWYATNIKYPADFDSLLLVINEEDIDKEVSLQEALKQQIESEAKENKIRQTRAQQQGYRIETISPGRESWLERIYEWE